MITVMGATGNVGSKLTEILLSNGKKVRAIARSADKLRDLTEKGAEIFAGNASDVKFLTEAFSGSDAVFTMIPPDMKTDNLRAYYNLFGETIASAIRNSGIKNVFNLSSHGADLSDGTGPIKGLHDQENRLNSISGLNLLHLRPTYFMENTLMFAGLLKSMGMVGSAIAGDIKMPMIATKDIASFAAAKILSGTIDGISIYELYGERDLTMNEVASVFGSKIGMPDLKYTQFPYFIAEKGLQQFGISADVAKQFIEMSKAFNEGLIKMQPRTPENTTPTSIEEFADLFAAVYNKSK